MSFNDLADIMIFRFRFRSNQTGLGLRRVVLTRKP